MLSKKLRDELDINLGSSKLGAELADSVDAALAQSGTIVLQDGDEMSGEYFGAIICLGSATMTGDVIVHGNLFVIDTLTNSAGFALTVNGDFFVSTGLFTPGSLAQFQNDLIINGNMFYDYFEMYVNPNNFPSIYINGDLTNLQSDDDFRFNGQSSGSGGSLHVSGDVTVEYINLGGGNSDGMNPAGSGGTLLVGGNAVFYDGLDIYGGDNADIAVDAGNGGEVFVVGDIMGYIYGHGGNASGDGSGGNGASVNCYGNLVNYWMDCGGGDCYSTKSNHRAGSGGSVNCTSLIGDSYVGLYGGYRGGDLAEGDNTVDSADAGSILAYGDVSISHGDLQGGNVDANFLGVANAIGGQGGNINAKGDFLVWYVGIGGGSSIGQNGGNAGSITVKGKTSIEYALGGNGGSSDTQNGSAGNMTCKAGLVGANLSLLDGSGEGSAGGNDCGIFVGGNLQIATLNQVDRSNSYIKAWSVEVPVIAAISNMLTKQTLNKSNNDPTTNVSEGLASSIFKFHPGDTWYAFTGTGI